MPLPYTLVRSNRRTLALVVDRIGALIARAPRRMALREIEALIAEKERWILEKQAMAQKRMNNVAVLAEGQEIPFGNQTLILCRANIPFSFAYHGMLLLPAGVPLSQSLSVWLRFRAEALLLPRVAEWESFTGLHAQKTCFSTAQTRWGSMTSEGVLRLNTALVLCPSAIVDYVILHELVHRKHLNHSPAFWKAVEDYMPDYRVRRAWLKQNNHLIRLPHEGEC